MAQINLAPADLDIAGVRAGDRNLFQVTIRSGGAPIDLTGYTITAQARTSPPDIAHLDAGCDIDPDPTTGRVDIHWPAAAVTTWLAGNITQKGVCDLQLSSGTGDPWTVVAGDFAAELEV